MRGSGGADCGIAKKRDGGERDQGDGGSRESVGCGDRPAEEARLSESDEASEAQFLEGGDSGEIRRRTKSQETGSLLGRAADCHCEQRFLHEGSSN